MTSKGQSWEHILDNPDEITRLSYNHELFKDALNGKLVLAPIDFSTGPKKILDSATADGDFVLPEPLVSLLTMT